MIKRQPVYYYVLLGHVDGICITINLVEDRPMGQRYPLLQTGCARGVLQQDQIFC